jgi:imidazolonepropionase-like amidohydrolase
MTPFQALRTATVNSAQALGLNVGTVEAGRLADLVIVEGNPLVNIAATYHVVQVIANGRLYNRAALLGGIQ